jgi:hypothetical protein
LEFFNSSEVTCLEPLEGPLMSNIESMGDFFSMGVKIASRLQSKPERSSYSIAQLLCYFVFSVDEE